MRCARRSSPTRTGKDGKHDAYIAGSFGAAGPTGDLGRRGWLPQEDERRGASGRYGWWYARWRREVVEATPVKREHLLRKLGTLKVRPSFSLLVFIPPHGSDSTLLVTLPVASEG